MIRTLFVVALLAAFAQTPTFAQVNSWTNATSSNWDQTTNWSLGVLPNSSQSVMIANAGFKAVAINPSTPINFTGTMTVSNLTIRGGVNTLLLNFFGTAVPLTVLNGLTVADSGRIVNFSSGLVVQGGAFGITNAEIIQDGGFVRTTNVQMDLSNSRYQLTNGVFEGGTVRVGAPVLSSFNQYGGTVVITNLLLGPRSFGSGSIGGGYALYGGNLELPGGLTLLADNGTEASYLQSGGTNQTTRVTIEPGLFGIAPSFKLNGGLLADNDVNIFGDDFASATLEQNGGTHVVSNLLQIAGGAGPGASPKPGTYKLNGGTLVSRSILLDGTHGDAVFVQTNGSAQAGQIQASSGGPSTFFITRLNFSGGALTSSNLFINDGGTILQSGGVLTVSNVLGVLGFRQPGFIIWSRYTFIGGTITASNINVGADWIIGDSLTNRISNPGTITLSHFLQISNAVELLGRFILASNSIIDLAGSASRLSFANSSGETWAGNATLMVSNWNGNLSGGGAEQLKFGTNQSGLTVSQLNQIQFVVGTNLFSAKILNTGEVVPNGILQPSIAFSKQGNNLVLNWPAGWLLQTATNVPGPYVDVSGASSPYTNDVTLDPQRFFRLRQ
jgi:hypothetical protein